MSVKELYDGTLYVELTGDEIPMAEFLGRRRNQRNEALGRDPNYRGLDAKLSEDKMVGDELHIHGKGGETAVSKGLGIYDSSNGQYYHDDEDVSGIQARCRTEGWHDLYLRGDETKNVPWVLLWGVFPGPYHLLGWAMAENICIPEFWRPAHPKFPKMASFIPPIDLLSQDWDTLIEWANDYRKLNLIGHSTGVNT